MSKNLPRYLRYLIIARYSGMFAMGAGVILTAGGTSGSVLLSAGILTLCCGIFILTIGFVLTKAVQQGIKAEEQLEATMADCDAGEAFFDWFGKNRDRDVARDPEAQQLLKKVIETRKRFLDTHEYIHNKKSYLEYLESLVQK